jgi:hypothetical protein
MLLEQGHLGKGDLSIIENCVREINSNKASTEYIQVVLEHIQARIVEGQLGEAEGVSRIKGIVRTIRHPYPYNRMPRVRTKEEEMALEAVIADAFQRMSLKARRGWR